MKPKLFFSSFFMCIFLNTIRAIFSLWHDAHGLYTDLFSQASHSEQVCTLKCSNQCFGGHPNIHVYTCLQAIDSKYSFTYCANIFSCYPSLDFFGFFFHVRYFSFLLFVEKRTGKKRIMMRLKMSRRHNCVTHNERALFVACKKKCQITDGQILFKICDEKEAVIFFGICDVHVWA